MSLGLTLKNHTSIVIAADHADNNTPSATSHFITLHNHSVIVISGNRAAVEPVIMSKAIPQVTPKNSTASVAQYIHAALLLEVVPNLPNIPGRTEILIAGIDPIRHTTEPDAYYLDSANDFYLTIGQHGALITGSTAIAADMLKNVDIINQSTETLVDLAKECFTATRLRWPTVVAPRLKLAVVSPGSMKVYDL